MILYKIIGWILIIAGIIWAGSNLYFSWCTTCSTSALLYEVGFGLLYAILIFIFLFFPGKFYLKVDKNKENKLVKSSLILTIIAIIIAVIGILIGIIACYSDGAGGYCDPMASALPIAFGAIIGGIIYGIAILLLIINWFKNR